MLITQNPVLVPIPPNTLGISPVRRLMSKRTHVLQKEKDTQKIVHEREEIQLWKYESMTEWVQQNMMRHFFPLLAFFAGGFSSLVSSGALRLVPPATRELFLEPSAGAFFSFFGALGFVSVFFPVAFLALLALGFSFSSVFSSSSFVSDCFFSSDLA